MKLKVLLPSQILINEEALKISVEAENGSFTMLPRHIDFVAALVPGLLSFVDKDGEERFLAVNEGILVKCGSEVLVSSRDAVIGPDLGELRRTVEQHFTEFDEHEKVARAAVARLEADLVRRFMELEQAGNV
jgi:F-type H+-transporting ATPase subunit epsilon